MITNLASVLINFKMCFYFIFIYNQINHCIICIMTRPL